MITSVRISSGKASKKEGSTPSGICIADGFALAGDSAVVVSAAAGGGFDSVWGGAEAGVAVDAVLDVTGVVKALIVLVTGVEVSKVVAVATVEVVVGGALIALIAVVAGELVVLGEAFDSALRKDKQKLC